MPRKGTEMQTVGTCGKCGGPVMVPMFWGGPVPPTPTCGQCGARAASPYGQVMPMVGGRDDDGTDALGAELRRRAQLVAPNAELTGPL